MKRRKCPTECEYQARTRERWPEFTCNYECHELHKPHNEWSHFPFHCTGVRYRVDFYKGTIYCQGCTIVSSVNTDDLEKLNEFWIHHWWMYHQDLMQS